MKKRNLMILGCMMILAACSNNVKAPEKEMEKTHLNAGIYWSADTLDPAVDYDGWTSSRAGITETLVSVDEKLAFKPVLADKWEQKDDTTWVFHIRDNATFHNGKKVDAAAVKASFERIMSLQERAKTAAKIKEIKAEGQNLTIVTSEPFGALVANLSEPLYSVTDVSTDKDQKTNPIGTGPFKVVSFTPEKEIQTERYDGYWGGAAKIKTMKIMTIADDTTRTLALQSGDIDLAQRANSKNLATLKAENKYSVFQTEGTRVRVMIMNHNHEQLKDINVRKAIENAIDYNALVKIMGETYTLAGALYPSSSPYAADSSALQKYDVEKAKEYLVQAGYKDTNANGIVDKNGQELQLRLTYDDSSMNGAMEALQSMASKVGIGIKLDYRENTNDINKSKDFDMIVRSWQTLSTGDPQWMLENMYVTGAKTNFAEYSNTAVDDIVAKLTVTFDQKERATLSKVAQAEILKDTAHVYLFGQNNYVISNKKVKNITAYPIDYYLIDNKISLEE